MTINNTAPNVAAQVVYIYVCSCMAWCRRQEKLAAMYLTAPCFR